MNAGVYDALRKGAAADARFSGASAVAVMQALDRRDRAAARRDESRRAPAVQTRKPSPTAMVIGGTGLHRPRADPRSGGEGPRCACAVARALRAVPGSARIRSKPCGVSLHDKDALRRR